MKALSVRQPWAMKINYGEKKIEFRTWKTPHRGPLLICSSKHDSGEWELIKATDENGKPVEELMPLPLGCMLCVVDLVDIRPMTRADAKAEGVAFDESLYAWEIELLYSVHPGAVSGKVNIFNVPDERIIPLHEGDEWWMFDYPGFDKPKPKTGLKTV